jgi:hypothetical protein
MEVSVQPHVPAAFPNGMSPRIYLMGSWLGPVAGMQVLVRDK